MSSQIDAPEVFTINPAVPTATVANKNTNAAFIYNSASDSATFSGGA